MQVLRRILKLFELCALFLIPVISGARYANPQEYEGAYRTHLQLLVDWSFLLIFWLSLGVLIARLAQEYLDGRLANRKEIKRVLDSLHKNYFQEFSEEDLFRHRVTLFRACAYLSWRHLFCKRLGYLRIFSRSGTVYQRSKTWFTIDDEHEEGNEGVAGRAWFRNAQLTIVDLPAWPDSANPGNDAICLEYADRGFIAPKRAASLGVKSRSIAGSVVRDQSGKKWGVLLLDSREPQGISTAKEKKALVVFAADLLTRLV